MADVEKFWTTGPVEVDGKKEIVVGTAHRNREGKTVDFRPVSRIEAKEKMIISAPRGQEGMIEPLSLEYVRVEKILLHEDRYKPGEKYYKEIGYSIFEGVEISASIKEYFEWSNSDSKAAYEAAEKEKTIKHHEKLDQERSYLRSIRMEDIAKAITSSEVAQLRNGKNAEDILKSILHRMFCAKHENPESPWLDPKFEIADRERRDCGYLDRFKAFMISRDERKKEERKQKWLAKERRT
ncbi:MAG: hypothetical protein WC788_05300 [Candidatus Paceibacterota bacterium]